MRNTLFTMGLALLLVPMAFAGAKDLSTGLTGAPVTAVADAEWAAKQQAAEEAAAKLAATGPAQQEASVAPGQLGPGDKIKLTVFGEEELSGEFEVDSTGSLMAPLVGEIKAKGMTPRELEARLTKTLSSGYLVNPRVSVEVMNFRPFFILGEVNNPGSYPWQPNMSVINAIALGGGYTPRASTGEVIVRRAADTNRAEVKALEDEKIFPGDVIRVEERFF